MFPEQMKEGKKESVKNKGENKQEAKPVVARNMNGLSTRAQIKDPEKVTNKMYGCNTDISSHFFRIFNLRPSNNIIIKDLSKPPTTSAIWGHIPHSNMIPNLNTGRGA